MAAALALDLKQELFAADLKRLVEVDMAKTHPAYLLHHVTCVDSRSSEVFRFELLSEEECAIIGAEYRDSGWRWQRELLDWWMAEDETVALKGRQLGVTWDACGLALWYALYRPGADVLAYSITEDDAKKVIERIWDMLVSVRDRPELTHLMNRGRVIRPARAGVRPTEEISIEFTVDGQKFISTISAMSSSSSAGHGRTPALVIFDEGARQEYARITWKAVLPGVADKGGKMIVISTANGMADERSGEGNFFAYLWAKAETVVFPKLKRRFLRWDLHPGRDEAWRESLSMPAEDKAEQYPNDPEEAFLLSGRPYFDPNAMKHYSSHVAQALFRGEFVTERDRPNVAKLVKGDAGALTVYELPAKDCIYGLAADIATGSGLDFSVGAVINLHTMAPAAELYLKADYDEFARQLHFLGLWFNTAVIAPEKAGGYGDTIIAYLRDGHEGRRSYPKIYRHRAYAKTTRERSHVLGFPMTVATRPKVVSELRKGVNGLVFPCVTPGFLREMRMFVHRATKPSPAADDGANDDCVMAWGIALELYSQFGEHEHDRRKQRLTRARVKKPMYDWEAA